MSLFEWWVTRDCLDDVFKEREQQHLKWGRQDHADGTGGGGRDTWETIARNSCDRATREGRLTWAHILDEEAAEALAETDKERLYIELTQVAAVAVAWLEKLRREGVR